MTCYATDMYAYVDYTSGGLASVEVMGVVHYALTEDIGGLMLPLNVLSVDG